MLQAGLLGWPVSHSVSPLIHSVFLDGAGISGSYDLFPVEPSCLAGRVRELADSGFTGLNITIPHKKNAVQLCSWLSPEAEAVGAVNTLVFNSGGIQGCNTDVEGFRAIVPELSPPFFVLGTGGAALAVQEAVSSFGCFLLGRGESVQEQEGANPGTIVNATPLGWNDSDRFPMDIPPGWHFADLNYNPRWTWRNALVSRGIHVVTGERMLVEQAACSFTLWTGYTPGKELKQKALEKIKVELNG